MQRRKICCWNHRPKEGKTSGVGCSHTGALNFLLLLRFFPSLSLLSPLFPFSPLLPPPSPLLLPPCSLLISPSSPPFPLLPLLLLSPSQDCNDGGKWPWWPAIWLHWSWQCWDRPEHSQFHHIRRDKTMHVFMCASLPIDCAKEERPDTWENRR